MITIEEIVRIRDDMIMLQPDVIPFMRVSPKMAEHLKAMPEFEGVKGVIGCFGKVAGVECHYAWN